MHFIFLVCLSVFSSAIVTFAVSDIKTVLFPYLHSCDDLKSEVYVFVLMSAKSNIKLLYIENKFIYFSSFYVNIG